MLENQFSSQNNNDFKDAPDDFDETIAEEISRLEEWRSLVEEYKKLSETMEKLNLIEKNEDYEDTKAKQEEWNDAVEEFCSIRIEATSDQEDEFSEVSCSFESEKGWDAGTTSSVHEEDSIGSQRDWGQVVVQKKNTLLSQLSVIFFSTLWGKSFQRLGMNFCSNGDNE